MTETPGSGGGREFLRATLRQRASHGHLALYARDLGLALAPLDAFAYGRGQLSPEALQALARHMCDANYDAATDLLSKARKPEPARALVHPATLAEQGWVPPKVTAGTYQQAIKPVKPVPVQAKPKRPGWVE